MSHKSLIEFHKIEDHQMWVFLCILSPSCQLWSFVTCSVIWSRCWTISACTSRSVTTMPTCTPWRWELHCYSSRKTRLNTINFMHSALEDVIVWTLFDTSQISEAEKNKKTDRETDMYKRNTRSMQIMLELLKKKKQFHGGDTLSLWPQQFAKWMSNTVKFVTILLCPAPTGRGH